jgi:hypothetical protein
VLEVNAEPSVMSWIERYEKETKPSFTFPKAVTTVTNLISKKKTESVLSVNDYNNDSYYAYLIIFLLVCICGLIYLWSIYSAKNTKLNKRKVSPSPPCHSFSIENIPITFP